MKKPSIILASTSPRRQHLMAELKLPFICHAPQVAENHDYTSARQLVLHNAALKSRDVSRLYPHSITLGSDTTVALDDAILNKPVDMADARRMLHTLSGRTHQVLTAVTLLCPPLQIEEHLCETSQVTFKTLSKDDIEHYFTQVNPLDKAGAYGIQEHSELIIENYRGSFNNIMGLPTEVIFPKIKDLYRAISLLS